MNIPQWNDVRKQNNKTKHVSVPRTTKTLFTQQHTQTDTVQNVEKNNYSCF